MYVLDFICVYDMVYRLYRKFYIVCKVVISCFFKLINLFLYDSNYCFLIYVIL